MAIVEEIAQNKSFLKWLYDYRLDKSQDYLRNVDPEVIDLFRAFYYSLDDYNPDINGFTLFFLVPPHLSSPQFQGFVGIPTDVKKFFTYLNSAVPFLAVDIQLPTKQVKIGEFNLRVGGIPLAEEVEYSTDLTVRYLDTKELHVYSLHSIWLKYIEEVSIGLIKPGNYVSGSAEDKAKLGTDSDYIANGNLDYATCAYVLKFTPDFKLTYFGRITGMIPQSLSPNDIITSRTSNEISMINVPYTIAFYHEFTYPELELSGVSISNPGNNIFLRDFKDKLHNFLRILG